MRRFIHVILIAILIPVPAGAIPADSMQMLVLGDSLSAAYNIPLERGWVSLLQQRIKAEYPAVQVVNASVSGETAENAVRRLPLLLRQHRPEIVVIELGGNDGLRGFKLDDIRRNLQTLIEMSKAAGTEVVLTGIQLHPNFGPKFNRAFIDLYKELAEEHKTHWVPFILQNVGDNPQKMQSDATHPTADAQPELLENMWPAIEAAIEAAIN